MGVPIWNDTTTDEIPASLSEHSSDGTGTGDRDADDIWAISEGYTPLQDPSLLTTRAAFALDDDEDVLPGFLVSTADSSTFRTSDTSIFFRTSFQDQDLRSDTSLDAVQTAGTPNQHLQKFQGIADKALRMLDMDYESTIGMRTNDQPLEPELGFQHLKEIPERQGIFMASDTTGTSIPEHQPPGLFHAAFYEIASSDSLAVEAVITGSRKIVQTSSTSAVNTDAVLRAVESIRLKHPTLSSRFEAWDRQHQEKRQGSLPPLHPIVPVAPLSAFRNSTTKAIQATARYSRSATLAEAMRRLDVLHGGGTKSLCIHVVGCDSVECNALESTFGPIVRWLGSFVECPWSIHFDLIGPNIPKPYSTKPAQSLFPTGKSSTRLRSATLHCHTCLYHEFALSQDEPPDLIVAFNAGIWGYDDWIPCLECILAMKPRIPFVATAYTVEESIDDFDMIQSVVTKQVVKDDTTVAICEWPAEANPFGSQMPRVTSTAVEGRTYRENAAWQAWRL